jgi:hypothetical protein
MKKDLEALRDHTIKVCTQTCEIFEVTCKYGHLMKATPADGRPRNCHKCAVDIEETYYRCKDFCDYDLCRRCAACP